MNQNKAIWVFDAGMMEAGGHHAALAETLCQAKVRQPDTFIKVFAHKLLDEHLIERFVESGISTELSFDSVFYKHFHDGAALGPAGMQKYIRILVLEYKQLLQRAINYSDQQGIVVFLPCLNWEHASALGFAISQLELKLKISEVKLVTCAMYSPATNDSEPNSKKMWYKMAFKSLVKHTFVTFYCSEQELYSAYANLLPLEECFVHPCYLMDWAGEKTATCNDTNQHISAKIKRYLLYMGDAKVDKGFNRLPDVLKRGLAATASDVEFVIQFTLAWEYPEIMATIKILKNWSKTEPRIRLHQGFWSNQNMVKMFKQIDGVICTYDTNTYQYKSSGLIWILAFFNKPLMLSDNCWLSREAYRLNVPLVINDVLDVRCLSQIQASTLPINSYYADKLFMPLIDWLLSH